MEIQNGFDDGKPQSVALLVPAFVHSHIGLPDSFEIGLGDEFAGVGDGDGPAGKIDPYLTAGGRIFDRVLDQVLQRGPEKIAVGADGMVAASGKGDGFAVAQIAEIPDNPADQLPEVEIGAVERHADRVEPAQIEHIVDEVVDLLGLPDDFVEIQLPFVLVDVLFQGVGIAADHEERGIDVVGQRVGQVAALLLLYHLNFDRLPDHEEENGPYDEEEAGYDRNAPRKIASAASQKVGLLAYCRIYSLGMLS